MKCITILALFSVVYTTAQVGINTTTPSPAAVLDVNSSSDGSTFGGFLLPKVDASGRADIESRAAAADEGLMIFFEDTRCLQIWNGADSSWEDVYCMPGGSGSSISFIQDFDVNTTWSYSSNPVPYIDGADIWNIVNTLTSISTLTGNFWGARDLDNPNGGGDFIHTLTFDTIDTSGAAGVVFSFNYESQDLNVIGDRYGYELFYDGISQGEVDICNGCNTDLSGTVTVAIPDAIDSVSVILYGEFNGGDDLCAFDAISLTN